MKALIVEIDANGLYASENPMYGPVMEVQETKSTAMARFAFYVGDLEHRCQVKNIGIDVYTIHAIRKITGQVCQISLSDVVLNVDLTDRQLGKAGVNALCGAIFIPGASCHRFLPRSEAVHRSHLTLRGVQPPIRCRLDGRHQFCLYRRFHTGD